MYTNTLTNWSYKKLKMYRACPYSVYLKYILRVPEPPQDPKFDEKRLRGVRVHDGLENAINLGGEIPPEAKDFTEVVEGYIELGAVAEGDEFFDRSWKLLPKEYSLLPYYDQKEHWLVIKKDVRVLKPYEFSLVADWKTGRKYGNEVDHMEQMKLYAVSEYAVDPGYSEYSVELQYIDQKDTWSHSFKPAELERHWQTFEKDVAVMFADTTFRPKPNIYTCRYCPYNKKNNAGRDLPCPVAAV